MRTFQSGIKIIVLILLIGACAKPPSQFHELLSGRIALADQRLFSRAMAHQKKGRIKPAIDLWIKFLEKYPNSYEARNNLGLLYYANDQITKAVSQFEQGLNLELGSVKIKSNLLRALKVRVAILEENKEYDEAITDLKRMAELSPITDQEKIERYIEGFEDQIFKQVTKSDLREEYQRFLEKYPNSPRNSDEARSWIQESQQTGKIKQEDQFAVPESFVPGETPDIVKSLSGETTEIIEKPDISESKPAPTDFIGEQPIHPPSPKMVEVIKPEVINVHSEPKIESGNIVFKLKTGAQVIYADEHEGWYQVEFANGEKGWIIKKYARLLE